MCGRDIHLPHVRKAGAGAIRWHKENKDRPRPTPSAKPPPYNAADTVRVRALITRLGVSQAKVARAARACGVRGGALSNWLCGRDTHMPSVLKAGTAALRWHEQNKGRLA